jgi:DNA polymerase III gamma/tau subunit
MELMEHFRNLLVVLYAGKEASALELPEVQIKFYEELARNTAAGRVLRIIDALVETDGRMRFALSKKTLLETGLIRCSRAAETASINELLKQVAELKKNFKSGDIAPRISPEPSAPTVGETDLQKKKAPLNEVKLLSSHWKEVVERVSKADPLSRRYLLDTVPLRTDARHLVVGFDPEFAQEKERFDNARSKLTLARAVERYVNRMLGVIFEPLPASACKSLPADHPMEGKPPPKLSGEAKWYANPIVKNVVEAFNGEISDVRE